MAAPNTTVWRHVTGTNSGTTDVVWYQSSNSTGTHAISGGGYANGLTGSNGSSTDQGGNDVSAAAPVVGSFPSYDSGTDTTYWMVGFLCPPGASLRMHIFCILA